MSSPVFGPARMTNHLVNRRTELEIIKEKIFSEGHDTRLVLIEGDGGVGKTRLLREVLCLMGHPDPDYQTVCSDKKWPSSTDSIIISGLLDLADTRRYTFQTFMQDLRKAFTSHKAANFSHFDRARTYHERKLHEMADYSVVKKAAEEAERAFFEDYQTIAVEHRLVWVLDTAERLGYAGAGWLVEEKLLTPQDLSFSTQRRLLELLMEDKLPNTTILLAGRRTEGKVIFDEYKDKKNGAGSRYNYRSISLGHFSQEDTRMYLAELARNWSQWQPDTETAADLQDLAKDTDRADVLWLYTGGQPVRLALFVDVLMEGKAEPARLQDTFVQAKEYIGWDDKKYGQLNQTNLENLEKHKPKTFEKIETKIKAAQFEIEGDFIDLIFSKGENLRAQILKVLAQARRGLNARHLHFVLDAPPDIDIAAWEANTGRLKEIQDELEGMSRLSFIKTTPEGWPILQDEMYNIYDKHAADEITRPGEIHSRQSLYRRLLALVDREIEELTAQKAQNRQADERALRAELQAKGPTQALSVRFPFLTEVEVNARTRLKEGLHRTEAERLYYKLRINPDEALNDDSYDLANRRAAANDFEADAQVQAEVWRVLTDELAHQFIELLPREETTAQPELWASLQRAAQQEDIARWLKRFVFTKQYQRAVDFAEQVEAFVGMLPTGQRMTLGWTLGHTFSRGERACWRELARIYLGQDRLGAIRQLAKTATDLERLLQQGIPERGEKNFLDHPAEIRLRRVIGLTYNSLGFGYVTQGQFRKAVRCYAEALRYFRETGFLAQRAQALNNLSRALSEIGRRTRAIRVCRDGLDLRLTIGDENPIAYSYNTLALIYNNNLQPDDAWPEATRAVVYFRRLDDPRGLGLSLLQLGEALRRLAFVPSPLMGSPEELLNVAENATLEALDIFTNTPEVKTEIMRRIEVEVELGSLYRDYMNYVKNQAGEDQDQQTRWQRLKDLAQQHLSSAITLSKSYNYPSQQLDAQVNLAWTHYYAGDLLQAEEICQGILKDLESKPFTLKKHQTPPLPQEIDETYALFQLGKLWTVKGRIELDRFNERVQTIKSAINDGDEIARLNLQEAAEAFVQSLGYAQLFSPRSPNIGTAFDHLYNYLKKFNVSEIKAYAKYQHEAQQAYWITKIQSENLADPGLFLRESFGDFLREEIEGEVE